MTTNGAAMIEYGRARVKTPATVVEERDLSDPKVVRAIIADATKVARAEQKKRTWLVSKIG